MAIGYGLWLTWVAASSRRWPTTTGVILEAKVASRRESPDVPEKHRAAVRYRYTVRGQAFEGARVAFGDFIWSSFRPAVVRLVTELEVGSEATVYYDPARPRRSVLRPGTNWALCVVPTVALLPLVVGLLLIYE